MDQVLTVHLRETAFDNLEREAHAVGTSPSQLANEMLERQLEARPSPVEKGTRPERRFRDCFGLVDSGSPTGGDNEIIDADLVHEYGDTHQEA